MKQGRGVDEDKTLKGLRKAVGGWRLGGTKQHADSSYLERCRGGEPQGRSLEQDRWFAVEKPPGSIGRGL